MMMRRSLIGGHELSSDLLVVGTGGAGGDLQPLLATGLALQNQDRTVSWVGDAGVARALSRLGLEVVVLDQALDLGPRLIAAVRDAQALVSSDLTAPGRLVQQRLGQWAADVATALRVVIDEHGPRTVVTSLFGVEAVALAEPARPWAVINSTFYLGPGAPRPLEADIAARALPLIRRYVELLDQPDLVLHATDQIFDLSFDGLPAHHHYTGPLGRWEPPAPAPAFLEEPGDPWVLVTISSQLADDVPLAQAAVSALADEPVRVLVTVGPDHDPAELGPVPANCRVVPARPLSGCEPSTDRSMPNEPAHGLLTEQTTVPGYPQPQPDTRKAVTRDKCHQPSLPHLIEQGLIGSRNARCHRAFMSPSCRNPQISLRAPHRARRRRAGAAAGGPGRA